MTYELFYDIAEYLSENGKGYFTAREIAIGAYDYVCEWERSIEVGMVRETIEQIINLLERDGSDKAKEYFDEINYQIERAELI